MKLKIGLFFTNTNQDYNKSAASTWIRIWQMIETYRELGAEVHVNDYFQKYDVAIVFRKSKRKYYYILKYLKLISKTIYFDTCINIYELNPEIDVERQKYARKISSLTNGILCASKQIEKIAAPFANSAFTMEDPINTSHFSEIKTDINFDNPVFGWSGVGAKAIYLNNYSNKIDNNIYIISEEHIKDTKLDFNYQYSKWKYETFPKDLLMCDIALLPRDTESSYNKCHSSFKALVFAALGIPIIASKVPSYIDLAQYYDGIVFLEDYNDNIDDCISELKKRNFAPAKVRKHYSRENQAKLLFSYFESQLKKS